MGIRDIKVIFRWR